MTRCECNIFWKIISLRKPYAKLYSTDGSDDPLCCITSCNARRRSFNPYLENFFVRLFTISVCVLFLSIIDMLWRQTLSVISAGVESNHNRSSADWKPLLSDFLIRCSIVLDLRRTSRVLDFFFFMIRKPHIT